ncbi:MAG TPA: endonuclease/exonuclease/phosphatase family protein [Opitutaceae bacterium]|nr:endonuclease/exonuclease/phosphatase family protein [Opitutaceae bacterium]
MFAKVESFFRHIRRRLSHREWAAGRRPTPEDEFHGEAPGLLLIQIDGLSRTQLERAVAGRRMPFLRRLLRHEGGQLRSFYPGLPSTTAAVQAELYYGVRAAVPAYSFYDRIKRRHVVMCSPEWAKEVDAAGAAQAPGLLEGGSSWSNIYAGGASLDDAHFCAASIGLGDLWRTGRIGSIFMFLLLHPLQSLFLAGLLVLELLLALWDLVVGVLQGERVWPEMLVVASRVFIGIGLRELVTIGAASDLARGLPVVHVNYLGYDENAHRRGPGSAFAHWSLLGIDRAVRALYHAAETSRRRDYSIWIFSDHGQERVRSFDQEVPGGVEEMLRSALELSQKRDPAWRTRSQRRPLPAWWRRPRDGADRRLARWTETSQLTPGEEASFTVAGIGPLAHVYFAQALAEDRRAAVARRLVGSGVPGVLLKRDDGAVTWFHGGGESAVPGEVPDLLPHPAPVRAEMAEDLAELVRHPHAGDLVLLGWSPGSRSWSFAPERGAHGGIGLEETCGFVILPPGVRLPPGTGTHLRPATLRTAALHFLGRAPLARTQPVPVAGDTLSLRVLSYNTHSCHGMDGRVSPRRIARVIGARSPDIVALQELDLGRRRSRAVDQAAIIAELLEMHFVFCPTVTRGAEHYGHALLSRWPIEVVRRAFLPAAPGGWWREPRAALWARIIIGARRLNVITTHLGLGLEERRLQMEALVGPEWIGAVPAGEDVVLCGDFNATPGSPAYRLAARTLRDAQASLKGHSPLRTFSSTQPFARIDHIFASAAFVPERIVVPRDRVTRVASDHLPLVVDFAIGPAADETPTRKSA